MYNLEEIEELDVPILFSKMSKNFNKKFGDYLNPYGLSKLHAFYLVCLFKNKQGLTLNQLNSLTGCDKANTSRAIADLEEKGIVTKNNKDIEKKYEVCLTDNGWEITDKFVKAVKEDIKNTLSILTSEEITSLQQIIAKLLINELKGKD